MNRSVHPPVGCALTLLLCLLPVGVAGNEQEVTVEDVAAELQRRQQRVRSARIVWELTRTYPKGSLQDDVESELELESDTSATYPAKDTTVRAEYTLWLEGSKWKSTRQGKIWGMNVRRFVEHHSFASSDGHASRSFIAAEDLASAPFGVEHHNGQCKEITLVEYGPLLWSFRATDPMRESGRFVAEEWSVSNAREELDGVECVVLKRTYERPRVDEAWFAPGQGFSLVQYRRFDKGQLTLQIDVEHSRDNDHGWVPATWKITSMLPDGKLDWLMSGTVKEYAINLTIDPQTFAPEFPVGTVVRDERTDSQYLVTEDGEKPRVAFVNNTIVRLEDDSYPLAFWLGLAGLGIGLVLLILLGRRAKVRIRQ